MADTAMTIGERLEEARKKKGISIREAAEATKVRGDYLQAMESNSFEINLPEIYVRGFYKIYVNFLRLDAERYMTDYDAMRMSTRKTRPHTSNLHREPVQSPAAPPPVASGQQTGHVSFGRMELSHGEELPASPVTEPAGRSSPLQSLAGAAWLRPAVITGIVALGILLIVLLILSLSGGDKPQLNSELAAATAQATRPITLVASDYVTVKVVQADDGKNLFTGTLAPGQTKVLSNAVGTLEISYNNGKALQVERDGARQGMSETGRGKNAVQ